MRNAGEKKRHSSTSSSDSSHYVVREENEYFVIELPEDDLEAQHQHEEEYAMSPSERSSANFSDDGSSVFQEEMKDCSLEAKSHKTDARSKDDSNKDSSGTLNDKSSFSWKSEATTPKRPFSQDWSRVVAVREEPVAKHLAVNQYSRAGSFLFYALLPVADIVSDVAVTAVWYARGNYTMFWISVGIFAWSALAANVLGWATRKRDLFFASTFAGCLPLSLVHFNELFCVDETWDTSTAVGARLGLSVLGVIAFETAPQVVLQSYALISQWSSNNGAHGAYCETLIASLAIGVLASSSGLVSTFMGWERTAVRIFAFLFIASMILARCAAYISIFVQLDLYVVFAFIAIGLLARLFVLRYFKVVGFDNLHVETCSNSVFRRHLTAEELLWTRSLDTVAAATSRFHAFAYNAICLAPVLCLTSVVPLGARVEPGLNKDGHYFEGIKRLFSFSGSSVNTFRNRLASDLAIAMIGLHVAENLAMILATILVGYTRSSREMSPVVLVRLGLVPLGVALLAYAMAAKLVKSREKQWISDIASAKNTDVLSGKSGHKKNFLTTLVNRKGSLWSSVIVKQKRPGPETVLCHLPDLVRFCSKKFRGSKFNYTFDGVDALFSDLDRRVWHSADYAKFETLGLRGLLTCSIEEEDLDDMERLLSHVITDDNARPMLRDALDQLACEFEDLYDNLYTTNSP